MSYPKEKIKFLIIDSGSTDGTNSIAKNHLKTKVDKSNWRIHSFDEPGKSLAVNQAIEMIDTQFFVMMDADSHCPPDSLERLIQWFEDPSIGAVCAHQSSKIDGRPDPYRSRFNIIRVGESVTHSTPIFEGSLCAFRLEAIGSCRVNPQINADDSQLAMIAISNGFRSVMDPELAFSEPIKEISRKRRIRRSQGLSRALWENRKLVRNAHKMRLIMNHALYFHIIMPWLILISLASIVFPLIGEIYFSGIGALHIQIALSSMLFVVPITRTGRGLISGTSILLESHARLLLGQRLQVWVPDRRYSVGHSGKVEK